MREIWREFRNILGFCIWVSLSIFDDFMGERLIEEIIQESSTTRGFIWIDNPISFFNKLAMKNNKRDDRNR